MFTDELPLHVLGLMLPTHLRRAAMTDEASVGDARSWVRSGVRPPPNLTRLGSSGNLRGLAHGIRILDLLTHAWLVGDRWDSRRSWLLGPTRAGEVVLDGAHLQGRESADQLDDLPPEIWMPYMSLEGVRVLRRLGNTDHALLEGLIGRFNRWRGHGIYARPWNPDFPVLTAALPILSLYGTEPSDRARTILRRLHDAGLTNIGYLVTCHPIVIQHAHRLPDSAWQSLWRTLGGEDEFNDGSGSFRHAASQSLPERQDPQ